MSEIEPSAVSYTANLPLSWRATTPSDAVDQVRRLHANIALLRGLASIEATVLSEAEYERDNHLTKSLERLEAKVDIAINLLARIAMNQTHLPNVTTVTLRARSIEWLDPAPPQANQEIVLMVYLSPKLPEPLMLKVQVKEVMPMETATQCVGELTELDEEFEDWMNRTVFRYHRRELQARHQS